MPTPSCASNQHTAQLLLSSCTASLCNHTRLAPAGDVLLMSVVQNMLNIPYKDCFTVNTDRKSVV